MKRTLILVATLCLLPSLVIADNGLIKMESPHSATMTIDRLQAALEAKGIQVMARVRHQRNAEKVELELRPTELLIFGNPNLGTHMMTAEQTAGIDLPMKALAWEDADGKVWLAYNDPAWIAKRHGIQERGEIVGKMQKALETFSKQAVSRE